MIEKISIANISHSFSRLSWRLHETFCFQKSQREKSNRKLHMSLNSHFVHPLFFYFRNEIAAFFHENSTVFAFRWNNLYRKKKFQFMMTINLPTSDTFETKGWSPPSSDSLKTDVLHMKILRSSIFPFLLNF